MYKITFELKSPISFIEPPVFDSIIAYCYMKEYYPEKMKFKDLSLDSESKIDFLSFENFPIKKHESGLYFLSSFMQYEKEKGLNFTGSWKKRWDNKHDKIADFGKSKRQIEIDKGAFKSYDMPLNLYVLPKVWFYFDSDNIKEVEKLVTKHLYGLGKKTSQGYGEISNIQIETLDYNPFDNIIRPVPIKSLNIPEKEKTDLMLSGKVSYCAFKPPYWETKFFEACLIS